MKETGIRLGVDIGLSGAIAVLNDDLSLVDVYDMPTLPLSQTKKQVNPAELSKVLGRWLSQYGKGFSCNVELVHSMPKQGVSSSFSFGTSYGIVLGVLAALQIPVVLVTPQSWKKQAGLAGKEKDYCRTLMQQLYPGAELGRKKDIGRADALCIARFSEILR